MDPHDPALHLAGLARARHGLSMLGASAPDGVVGVAVVGGAGENGQAGRAGMKLVAQYTLAMTVGLLFLWSVWQFFAHTVVFQVRIVP